MFHARLKSARKNAGLSQVALATAVGISQSYVTQMEAGNKVPSVDIVKTLAEVLGVSPGWLMGEEVREGSAAYQRNPQAAIMADYEAPPGLRDLAGDKIVMQALDIQPYELVTLRSLQVPVAPSKDGYIALLLTLRAVCPV